MEQMVVNYFEMEEIQTADRELLIGSDIAHLGLEGAQFFCVSEIKLVSENRRTRVAILIGYGIIHGASGLSVRLDDQLPPFFRTEILSFREHGISPHLRREMDALNGTYFPEARTTYNKARCFAGL
ncbi:hypothetical protein [Bradyrhizobium sp.]|uniref:hypothetical protein n=1 Tax=Bradyrhizobium sp. TaxID=376 RepID=UPI00345D0F7A